MRKEMGFVSAILPVLLAGCMSQSLYESAATNHPATPTLPKETPWEETVRSQPNPTILTVAPEPTRTVLQTTFAIGGDVMLGRSVNTETIEAGNPNWPFLNVGEKLREVDITIINLEGPILDPCPPDDISVLFCSPTTSVEALKFAGIDVANLANNHLWDKNQEGYASTVNVLEENGIKPIDQDHLVIIDRGGVKFGVIGFNLIKQAPYYKGSNEEEILAKIKEIDSQVDVLMVNFHWGKEYETEHNGKQEKLAHFAIEAGADLIIGHHPHVTQDTEVYQNKLIIYSLGNLIFDQPWPDTKKGLVAILEYEGVELISSSFLPVEIKNYGQPQFVLEAQEYKD